jgi:ABC-type tungstate transport system permease subunit
MPLVPRPTNAEELAMSTTTSIQAGVNERESAEIERANTSGHVPVVFAHGADTALQFIRRFV